MSTVAQIVDYAIAKDAVNMRDAVNDALLSRIQDNVDAMRHDIAQQMFGVPAVEYSEPEVEVAADSDYDSEGHTANEEL